MYKKAHKLRGQTSKGIRTFGIEHNQSKIVTDNWRALRIWEKYIQDLYDSENFPNNIAIGAEEKLNEDDKLPTIPKSEVARTINIMERKKATRDDNILVDFIDVTMIAFS